MTEKRRYDAVAIWLHWLVALLVLAQYATGWVWGIFERGSEPRFYLFRTHIMLGSVILALAVARVGWRLIHRAPPLPEGMTRLQRIGAHAGHGLLYLAILVQPALGLLAISGFGKTLGRWPRDAHNLSAKLIIAIVIIHVAAVIWHQMIRRDGLMKRMLPPRFSA